MNQGAGEGKNMVNESSLIAAAGLAMGGVVPFLYSVWLSAGTALITLLGVYLAVNISFLMSGKYANQIPPWPTKSCEL